MMRMSSGHIIVHANIYHSITLHLIPLNRSGMVPSYCLNADIDKCNQNHFQHRYVHGHMIRAKIGKSSSIIIE